MTTAFNQFSKLVLLIFIAAAITACGGNKKPPVEADVANVNDITRPPEVTKDRQPAETESNPDETISYDEWRRRREAEQAESAQSATPK